MSAHSHRPKATEQTAKPTQEAPFFQAKLTVNTPGDAYEQEADAVADQVMRMQEGDAPIVQRMPLTSVGDVQRKCANCEQEEEQQAQRKETGGGDASGKAAPGIVSDVLSSGAGRPMEGGTRQFMESRFGQDFGQVRVHTDSRAAESASAIQARAYTSGRDIVFGAGQYQPESEGGKRLLAHELAHVGQQGGGDVRRTQHFPVVQRLGDLSQAPPMTCELADSSPSGTTLFDFQLDSSTLNRTQKSQLSGFADGWHAGGAAMDVRIDGYASTDGDERHNWELSCQRATEVKNELINPMNGNGIPASRVHTFAQGETDEFSRSLNPNRRVLITSLDPIPAPGTPRTEVTDFGTYEVYPDAFVGPLLPNQLREADFSRLRTAWDNMKSNSGGMVINGSRADKATLLSMFAREIQRSITFRNLILEIVEDIGNPVIIDVGRNNAYFVDSFATNAVDLNDIETMFPADPIPGEEFAQTQGEIMVHWLSERRFAAVNGRANFPHAHSHPMQVGGDQERYRQDLGQPGRVTSQVRVPGVGGLEQAVFTDNLGNVTRTSLDVSGGDPVIYQVDYIPVGSPAPSRTRRNQMSIQVNSNSVASENVFVRFRPTGAGATVTTATQALQRGVPQRFASPYGGIAAAGANITIDVFSVSAVGANILIGSITWNHPFDNANNTIIPAVAGTIYNIEASLSMDSI